MSNSSSVATNQPDADITQLVSSVYLALLAAIGAVGNSVVAATIIRMSQLHRPIFILVGNMSAVGLVHSVLAIPMHVTHSLLGPASWNGRAEVVCKVQAQVNFALVLTTLANSSAIAVCRYKAVHATHSVRAETGSLRGLAKLVIFIWVLPALVAVSASPFLGFNPLLSDCFFLADMDQAFWFMNVTLAGPALASTAVMLVTYALIIKRVRESHSKVSSFPAAKIKGRQGVEQPDDSTQDQTNISPINKTGIVVFTTTVGGEENYGIPSTSQWPVFPPRTQIPTVTSGTFLQTCPPNIHLQPPNASPPSFPATYATDTLSMASRSSSSVSVSANDDGSEPRRGGRGSRQMKKEASVSVRLFLAFILFCLLYLPLCLAHVVHAGFSLRKEVWLVCYTLALSFASNAWLVYALLNREFRRAFKALFQGRRSF